MARMTTDTTTPDAAAGPAATPSLGRLATWRYVLNTANLPEGMTKPDAVSKWLVITRAGLKGISQASRNLEPQADDSQRWGIGHSVRPLTRPPRPRF
jgi:hypothetical protein